MELEANQRVEAVCVSQQLRFLKSNNDLEVAALEFSVYDSLFDCLLRWMKLVGGWPGDAKV